MVSEGLQTQNSKNLDLEPGICPYPFTCAEFTSDGSVFCCCPDWTKVGALGNINEADFEAIWNGEKAQHIRRSIYERAYSRICRDYCRFLPLVREGKVPFPFVTDKAAEIVAQVRRKATILNTVPTDVSISTDPTCNLYCLMCRPSRITQRSALAEKTNKIVLGWLEKNLSQIEQLVLCGDGEPFFSPQIKNLIAGIDSKRLPHLHLNFITNGQLLNDKMWDRLEKLNIGEISVSVNAARKDTYEKVNRGGSWDTLSSNLAMLSNLKREGKLHKLAISMVILKCNVDEMHEFVRMGQRYGCDTVQFLRATGEVARKENFFDFPSRKPFRKLQKMLNDPIMKEPLVNLSSLRPYVGYYPSLTEVIRPSVKRAARHVRRVARYLLAGWYKARM